uniref:Uncharacterized protein n=1 Tax=Anser cygnoides TaxID=8845 RepID=A0A8B9DKX7_ANSCY
AQYSLLSTGSCSLSCSGFYLKHRHFELPPRKHMEGLLTLRLLCQKRTGLERDLGLSLLGSGHGEIVNASCSHPIGLSVRMTLLEGSQYTELPCICRGTVSRSLSTQRFHMGGNKNEQTKKPLLPRELPSTVTDCH